MTTSAGMLPDPQGMRLPLATAPAGVSLPPGMFQHPMVRPPGVVPGVFGGSAAAAVPSVQASPVFPQQPGEPPLPVETPDKPPVKPDAGETPASPLTQPMISVAPSVCGGSVVAAAPSVQASPALLQPPVESRLTAKAPVEPVTGEVTASPVSQQMTSVAPSVSEGSAVAAAPLVQASPASPQPLVRSMLSGNSSVPRLGYRLKALGNLRSKYPFIALLKSKFKTWA